MKKILTVLSFALMALAAQAAGLSGVKIYIDPGHGSYGSNDRPNPTITYPTPSAAKGLSFYESNTNLWKSEELSKKLEAAGAVTLLSHTECGGTTDGTRTTQAFLLVVRRLPIGVQTSLSQYTLMLLQKVQRPTISIWH